MTASHIQEFYNKNPFPGPYTIHQLHSESAIGNRYISMIDRFVSDDIAVLDVGCGTGLITNLLALRYRSSFVGIDFSTAANFGQDFAHKHGITNAQFEHVDFFDYQTGKMFDVIICQSFLTHVPCYQQAVDKLKSLLKPGGIVLLGVYNTYGKMLQRLTKQDYGSQRLQLDQEHNPYENSFTHQQTLQLWHGFRALAIHPSHNNRWVNFCNVFNSRNGGLTLYALRKADES